MDGKERGSDTMGEKRDGAQRKGGQEKSRGREDRASSTWNGTKRKIELTDEWN